MGNIVDYCKNYKQYVSLLILEFKKRRKFFHIMSETRHVLPTEAEFYVESLILSEISVIGSMKWMNQNQLLYKLALQASANVKHQEEEFVKDYFVSTGKTLLLVHELLLMEIWKEKIFPEIISFNVQISSSVPLYMTLYHESTLATLLAVLLFHEDVIESINDGLIDIVDFCHRKLAFLLQKYYDSSEEKKDLNLNEELTELLHKKASLDFFVSIKTISLVTHVTQHIKSLPLCILHRLLNIHDFPMLLVSLMLNSPWKRISESGEQQVYEEDSWITINKSNDKLLNKVEGQIWICLIQLLLNEASLKKYEITNFRKNELLKLRSKLNGVIMSQIPLLEEMLRFLENLNFFQPLTYKPDIVIEQLPEMREGLLNRYGGMWSSIAKKQMSEYFNPTETELRHIYTSLSDSFNMDSLEAMLQDSSTCSHCHKKGVKKCSRCKSEWYCDRKCQVSHWPKHKLVCDLIASDKN